MDFKDMIRELRNAGTDFDDIMTKFNEAIDDVSDEEDMDQEFMDAFADYSTEDLLRAVAYNVDVPHEKVDMFVKNMEEYIKMWGSFDKFFNNIIDAAEKSKTKAEVKDDDAEKAIKDFLNMIDKF